ncbi:MAG: hypothetical protein WAX44_02380 [Minisyncoccia bacterium]
MQESPATDPADLWKVRSQGETVMTTQVVADGIAKRKPTVDEMETLLFNRIPDLIRRYKEGGLDPAGVNTTLQMVAEGSIITESKTVVVAPPKPKQDKFELLTTFEVTVPEGYNHATHLDTFRAQHQSKENKEFYFYNDAITDANYAAKATTKLTAGRRFLVKAFGIKKTVSSLDCLAKVKAENAVLTGAQGASLVYEERKNELPKGKYYVSFDEKDALWRDPYGYHRVPLVCAYSDDDFRFDLGLFEFDWVSVYVLLCFCDLPSDSSSGEAQILDA